LASILSQTDYEGVALEIVVVDNSRSGAAMTTLAAFADRGVEAAPEANPGVANAHNAEVNAASGQ
jgi:hypothetical protein